MSKPWWNWKKEKEEEDFEDWQYAFDDEKSDRKEIKKAAAAVLIFAVVYGLHGSGTKAGEFTAQNVRALCSQNTDFVYLAEQAKSYLPKAFNAEFLQRVRAVIAKPADPLLYMSAPVDGEIVTNFGRKTDAKTKKEVLHEGLEYRAAIGSDVKAASLGKIKKIAKNEKIGYHVVVEHGQDIDTVYGYLSEVLVKEGDRVTQGQVIAKSGEKPVVLSPLLYFELREKNTPVDPTERVSGQFPSKGGNP